MSTPAHLVKYDLEVGRKRRNTETERNEYVPTKKALLDESVRNKSIPIKLSLLDLCDATAQIVKKLLALGAENNWDDARKSQGRSMMAGHYRNNWLYLSHTDRGMHQDSLKSEKKTNWFETFQSSTPQTFFYYTPKTESRGHKGFVARNAAASVLSLTGSCDQHAFVLATLLRAILPPGTIINICGLQLKQNAIPHTFVIVGDTRKKGKDIYLSELLLQQNLLAIDAWTTIGGAVPLNDHFIVSDAPKDTVVAVDQSFVADGKDYLVKRVRKQKILLDIIKENDPDIQIEKSALLSNFMHHDLQEQINYPEIIKRDKYLSSSPENYNEMANVSSISEYYKPSPRLLEAFNYILENYPHKDFKRCLEYSQERLCEIIAADKNPKGEMLEDSIRPFS